MNKTKLAMAAMAVSLAATSLAYTPSEEVKRSQEEFAADRFGIFLHWGIYSMYAQGEWYLNYGPVADEYAKATRGFYPADFDADKWVKAIKASGAKYICFTTRHHDGFSMWHTRQSDYNIVDGTPFGRDILKELSEACQANDIKLHLYYSHLDWTRTDYPQGRTGHTTGRDSTLADWPAYYDFMNRQLTELLTDYGPVRAIWFDGWWDHDSDSVPFDWQLGPQYEMIHRLQPSCMVGNNHHQDPFEGEDIQIFERDVPGENTAGYSTQGISRLPLETCQTMNGMWGYKLRDTNYKDTPTLIRYLVKTAGQGANLLLNIGPQANGELPAAALDRLAGMGEWLGRYGSTIYGTTGSQLPKVEWGTSTHKGDITYLHVTDSEVAEVAIPWHGKVKSVKPFDGAGKTVYKQKGDSLMISLPPRDCVDYILEIK